MPETVGALLTVSVNGVLTLAPKLSVPVKTICKAAISVACGVPLNVRVIELKLSHDGKAAPLDLVALSVNVSFRSTSVISDEGNAYEKLSLVRTARGGTVPETVGALLLAAA